MMSFSSGLTNDVVKVRTGLDIRDGFSPQANDSGSEMPPTLNKQGRTWRPRSESGILQLAPPSTTPIASSASIAPTTQGTSSSASWPWMSFAVFRKGVYTINNVDPDKGRNAQPIPVDVTRRNRVGSARSNSILSNSQVAGRANANLERHTLISAGSGTTAQREANSELATASSFAVSAGTRRRPMSGTGIRSKFGRRYRLASVAAPRPDSTSYASGTVSPQTETKLTVQRNGQTKDVDGSGSVAAAALIACRAKLVAEAEANLKKAQETSLSETVKEPKNILDDNYLVNISSAVANTAVSSNSFSVSNPPQETSIDGLAHASSGKPNSMTTTSANHQPSADNLKSTLSFSYMTYINGHVSPSISQTVKSSIPVPLSSNRTDNVKNISNGNTTPLLAITSEAAPSVLVAPSNGTDTIALDHTSYISQQTKPSMAQPPSNVLELNRRPTATQISVNRQTVPVPEMSSTELLPLKSILKKNNNSFSSARYLSAGPRRIGAGGSLRLVDANSAADTRTWTPSVTHGARLPVNIPQRSFSVGPRTNFGQINRSFSMSTPTHVEDFEKNSESISRASPNATVSRPASASKRGVRFNMENTAVFEYEQPEKHSEILPNSLTDDDQWYRMMWHKLAGF